MLPPPYTWHTRDWIMSHLIGCFLGFPRLKLSIFFVHPCTHFRSHLFPLPPVFVRPSLTVEMGSGLRSHKGEGEGGGWEAGMGFSCSVSASSPRHVAGGECIEKLNLGNAEELQARHSHQSPLFGCGCSC